jgi:hydrogenase expression/formation protein HypD
MAIFKHGLKDLLPESLKLVSGPGCPICVTPNRYLDRAVAYARLSDVIVTTFGDMLSVPGSTSSLAKEKARGGDVRIVYSPLDALKIAQKNPDKNVVFLGVGFETTAPTVGATVLEAKDAGITNFLVTCTHKRIPPAMESLVEDKEVKIDAFLCPAHVSAIIGSGAYRFLVEDYGKPCSVVGFEPLDVLQGILTLVAQIEEGKPQLTNQYHRVVKEEGNQRALTLIDDVFTQRDEEWRGIGTIPSSGLGLSSEYRAFDADQRISVEVEPPKTHPGCACGDVLKGKMEPEACPLFRSSCAPGNPIGPCMASHEGSCSVHYRYGEN